ncbi:MAG: AbrB/MazE/SpoVT family DNA-binding domain-containing protein [Candidatus Woesearchaeota archaeon]
MRRKIVLRGKSSLTISLPRDWANNYNLNKGDEIEVTPDGNRLIISSTKDMETKRRSVDINALIKLTHRALAALYISGFDEVEVYTQDLKQLDRVQALINDEFMGFEIIEVGRSFLRAKSISPLNHDEFSNILKRMFHMVTTLCSDCYEGIEKKDPEMLKSLQAQDQNINRHADFCRRALNKRDQTEFGKSKALYYIVEQLEEIADGFKRLGNYSINNPCPPEQHILVKELYGCIRDFYELFYRFKASNVEQYLDRQDNLNKRFHEVPMTFHVAILYSIYTDIYDLVVPLLVIRM